MIHTVKGFGIVIKAEIDVFLELSCFFNDPVDVGKGSYHLFLDTISKMGGSWWRGRAECGPLEKGMANHFSILALKIP